MILFSAGISVSVTLAISKSMISPPRGCVYVAVCGATQRRRSKSRPGRREGYGQVSVNLRAKSRPPETV